MDTSLYINKIEEHLADTTTSKELNSDPTQAIKNDVLSALNYLHITYRIDDQTRQSYPPNPARTPLFYGLPKVRKSNISLRPLASACDSPTNQLFNYVTHLYNISWRHSPLTSGTANTSSSSWSPSHPYLRMPS